MAENAFLVVGKQVDNPNTSVIEAAGGKVLEPFSGAGVCPMEARIAKVKLENETHGKNIAKALFRSTEATKTIFVKEANWSTATTGGSDTWWCVLAPVVDGPNIETTISEKTGFSGGEFLESFPQEARIVKAEGTQIQCLNMCRALFRSSIAGNLISVKNSNWTELT